MHLPIEARDINESLMVQSTSLPISHWMQLINRQENFSYQVRFLIFRNGGGIIYSVVLVASDLMSPVAANS